MTGHRERLDPEYDFRVLRLPLSWYVDRIERRSFFSFTKVNHRFWELELALRREPPVAEEDRAAADRRHGRVGFFETGFREELLADLASLPTDDSDFLFATSHEGYPGSCRLEGATPDPGALFETMRALLPTGFMPHDGMLFKRATVTGEIRALYAALRDLPVLVVGPEWLDALGRRFGLRDCTHIAIPSREARLQRHAILERIVAARERIGDRDVAVLFEAGSLAAWLVRRLHGRLPRTFWIDVGRALDVCRPDVVFRHNWGRVFRRELEDGLGVVDARVRESRDAFDPRRRGARGASDAASGRSARPCATTALERDLASFLGLPEDWSLVATGSGAAALRTLATLEHVRAGRPLRWIAPAWMDSQSATVSAVARARRVDCDSRGLIDPSALFRLDPESWDAVFVSDPFGAAEGFDRIARLCEQQGKGLVVEGFAALDNPHRRRRPRRPEALCLGVERPWGAGALGMAVVHAEDAPTVRRLVRGEVVDPRRTASAARCTPSERAVLAARERLVDLTRDGTRRHLQYRRLAGFAAEAGWTVLGPKSTLERFATPSFIPLVARRPIARGSFRAGPLGLRLAGPPADPRLTVPGSLHARLVLAPCDPALERLGNDSVRAAFRDALPRAARAAALPAPARR